MLQEWIIVSSALPVFSVMSDLNFHNDASEDTIVPETTRGLLWCRAQEELLTCSLVRCQENNGSAIDVDVTQNTSCLLCNRINKYRGLSLFQRPYPENRCRRFFSGFLLPTSYPVIPAILIVMMISACFRKFIIFLVKIETI